MSTIKEFPLSEEYKKDTGVTAEDVRMFREWLLTQPHLPADHITDLDLILAFYACEQSSAVSKQVLDLNFTLKTHLDMFFKDRSFDMRIQRALSFVVMYRLPQTTKEGDVCIFCRLVNSDLSIYNFCDAVRLFFMIIDMFQYEEGTWPGLVIIVDMQGSTLGHITRIEIQHLQSFLYFLQEATFVKIKGFHFTNAPSFMDKLMFLMKPFLKKALMDALRIHQVNSKTLDEYYPMEALPKEAGGKFKSTFECRDEMMAKLKANNEFFSCESKKRVCESRRPGKPKTVTDFFGSVEGSFKKLDID